MKNDFLFIITLMSLLSCSKKNDRNQMIVETAPNAVFKLYNNKSDWANEVNPIVDKQLSLDGQLVLENLIESKLYYFDVYTPDFSYSNWYNRSYSDESAAQLRYQVGWNSSKYHNDSKIKKLLLGMAKQTKWKLIDVRDLDGTGSIWSTMTDCEKDKELVFQKDFKCMLDQKTNTSACPASQTDSYDFYTNQDGGQIYLRFTDIGIPDDTFSFLIDVIEETVGTAKIKRLKVINLVSNGKVGIFTKA